jgi:hypothetical protein
MSYVYMLYSKSGEEKRKEKEALRIEREKEIENKRKADEERLRQQEIIKARAVVTGPVQVGKIDLNPKKAAPVSNPTIAVEKPEVPAVKATEPVVETKPISPEKPSTDQPVAKPIAGIKEKEVVKEVAPQGYGIAWAGTSYQEKEMSGSSLQTFVFGLVFIFLILAAQYERWLMPLAVITIVPFAVFGAILAVYLRGLGNDIYFQIGLLILIGLSAKNAILIVEFAMQAQEKGKSILEATIEAARLRFRPIVMTSLAFTIGVLPLAISSGAGAGSRHAIGTGVIGGMIVSTTIAIFFIPLFYSLFARLNAKFTKRGRTNEA